MVTTVHQGIKTVFVVKCHVPKYFVETVQKVE